jgi:hypothetical protein
LVLFLEEKIGENGFLCVFSPPLFTLPLQSGLSVDEIISLPVVNKNKLLENKNPHNTTELIREIKNARIVSTPYK